MFRAHLCSSRATDMSFILDALRKSENERQRGAVPGIAQVPLAARRAALPIWAVSVIVLLGVAVLVLATAWWRGTRVATPTSAAATSVPLVLPPPTVAHPSPPTAPASAMPRNAAASPPPPRPIVAADAGSDDQVAQASPTSRVAAPAPSNVVSSSPATSPASATDDSAAAASLPSAIALAAEGVVLPTLRLELHAYSSVPAERYVFINGSKYTEGQRLAEGPQVVSIVPKGVVLSAQGRRFLLTPD